MAYDREKQAEYQRNYRARKKAEAEGQPIQADATSTQTEIAERVVKKKMKPRGAEYNVLEKHFKGTPSDLTQAILNATRYIKAEPCKSDEEMAERINQYFAECAEHSIIPKWETLSLALGISRQAAWMMTVGQLGSPTRQRMMQRAKDILSAIDAELVQTGKVNPVVYIFRAKNFYDMRDQQDVVITPNQPLGEQQTTEQLTEKYSTLIELDDGE